MAERLSILQVNTSDARGGAHRVGYELHRSYLHAGHGSWLAVGIRRTDDPGVLQIPPDADRSRWARSWLGVADRVEASKGGQGTTSVGRAARTVGEPLRSVRRQLGREDFSFPATRSLLDLPPEPVDVLHCHNLHGGYFDLRELARLSQALPTFLTLHDAWLLSGHCAHSFDCDRWRTGCGSCPDLTIYPPVLRDSTAWNWRQKRDIYSGSSLYIAAPCKWLMDRVDDSILSAACVEKRVIPYGVDRSVFFPGDQATARAALGLPLGAYIVLHSGTGVRTSIWRDFDLLRAAAHLTAEALPAEDVIFVAIGEEGPEEYAGRALIKSMAFQNDAEAGNYYRAADLYLHPARADTFPNAVLEALASGTPVVATSVGGIPEQLLPETGILVPAGDPAALAQALVTYLSDPQLRAQSGAKAAEDAAERFDSKRHATAYLEWYAEIVEERKRHAPAPVKQRTRDN